MQNNSNSYWQQGVTGSSAMQRPPNLASNAVPMTATNPGMFQGPGPTPGRAWTPGMNTPGRMGRDPRPFVGNSHDQTKSQQYPGPAWTQQAEIKPPIQFQGHGSNASPAHVRHQHTSQSQDKMPSYPLPPPPFFQSPEGQRMMPDTQHRPGSGPSPSSGLGPTLGPSLHSGPRQDQMPFPPTNHMHHQQGPTAPQMPNMMPNAMDNFHTPKLASELSPWLHQEQGSFGDGLSSDMNSEQQWLDSRQHANKNHGYENKNFKPTELIPYQSRHPKHGRNTSVMDFTNYRNKQDRKVSASAGEMQLENEKRKQEKAENEDSLDQKWVRNWLKGVKKKEPRVKTLTKRPSLAESRQILVRYLQLLNQMKEKRDVMSDCLNTDDITWQQLCNQMKNMKEELSTIQKKVTDSAFVSGLKERIDRTTRKRERDRRRRQEEWATREDQIRRQNERIDSRMAAALLAKQEKEREEELQKEVDSALSEVRRKKQDATKTLDLLRGLRKLRHLRKETAEKKGFVGEPGADAAFENKISGLENMMNKRKLLYVEEERALKVMLEEEHEETREKERRKQSLQEQKKAEKAVEEELQMIFGKDETLPPDHPLFVFRQFYQQAEFNLQALVNIRQQWDLFLVPDSDPNGSSVPVPWVMPPEPADHIWAAALEDSSES